MQKNLLEKIKILENEIFRLNLYIQNIEINIANNTKSIISGCSLIKLIIYFD